MRELKFLNIFIFEEVYFIYLLFFPLCNNLIFTYAKWSRWKGAVISNSLLIFTGRSNMAMAYKFQSLGE
jgi:hypothetical protein